MNNIDELVGRVKEAEKVWRESKNQLAKICRVAKAQFWIVAVDSIMPIITAYEESQKAKTELLAALKPLVKCWDTLPGQKPLGIFLKAKEAYNKHKGE